jgi:Flp pilus assembly protein TadG
MPVARVHPRVAAPTRPRATPPPRRARRGGDDRGSSSVEFAILFPIIVVLLFGGPQLAMWYFAREAAEAAAVSAARAASAYGAPSGAGQTAGDDYLAKLGSGTITNYSATVTDSATTVTIHIHANVPNAIPLPGFSPTVDVTLTRAKERFTTPDSP